MVDRRKEDGHGNLQCSFCGKSQKEVKKLIAGPTVYICDECIGLCNDIIAEEVDREDLLGALLTDHVLVQNGFDFARFRYRRRAGVRLVLFDFFGDDVVTQPDALVADVDGGAGDEFLHFFLRLAAERAAQVTALVVVSSSLHLLALKRISYRLPRASWLESSAPAGLPQANGWEGNA